MVEADVIQLVFHTDWRGNAHVVIRRQGADAIEFDACLPTAQLRHDEKPEQNPHHGSFGEVGVELVDYAL
jgi:hypothetical protein